MWRRDQLLGCCAGSFGLGLLVGNCFESGLLATGIGIGLLLAGFCLLKHR